MITACARDASSGPGHRNREVSHRRRALSRPQGRHHSLRFPNVDESLQPRGAARCSPTARRFLHQAGASGTRFIEANEGRVSCSRDLEAHFTPLPCCFGRRSAGESKQGSRSKNSAPSLVQPRHLSGRVIDDKDKTCRGTLRFPPWASGRQHECPDRQGWRILVLGRPARSDKRCVGSDRVESSLAIRVKRISVVEEDVETSYWPGGTTDAKLALPISVIPEPPSTCTAIRIRKAPYYRVVSALQRRM